MKKIFLLTDFSEAAQKACHFAQAVFDQTAAEFTVLHAYALQPDAMYQTAFLVEEARQSAQRNLHKLLAQLTAHFHPPHHSYHVLTAPGDPVNAVEAALKQQPYDLVVVGASGAGVTPRLGSVATGLIRHARTNVLVVPQTDPIKPLENVVLATDYRTLGTLDCLKLLEELVTVKQTRLTCLSIVDNKTPMLIGEDYEHYTQRLTSVFDRVETDPYFIIDDNAKHGIDAYLDAHTVDLLATVPHRKGLGDVVWNRSLTRRLAYHPRVPLLALYDPQLVPMVQKGDKPGAAGKYLALKSIAAKQKGIPGPSFTVWELLGPGLAP